MNGLTPIAQAEPGAHLLSVHEMWTRITFLITFLEPFLREEGALVHIFAGIGLPGCGGGWRDGGISVESILDVRLSA